MNFLAIMQLITQLLPIIHSTVDQVETIFPQSGKGAEKLALVKNVVETAIDVSDIGQAMAQAGRDAPSATVWPIVSGVIGSIVAMKKSSVKPTPFASVSQ
jgi:hypothetical protein